MSDQEKMEAMQLLTFSDVDMGMQNVGLARGTLQKTPSPKATHLPAMLFVAKYGSPTQAAVHFFALVAKDSHLQHRQSHWRVKFQVSLVSRDMFAQLIL